MRKALLIGIDAYATSALDGCVNDATALAGLLEVHGDGSPNFDVRLETGITSKDELENAVAELFSSDDPETCLFYFSGHGLVNELGAYLVTPDFEENSTGMSMQELLNIATRSRVKNKVIILDCCHSGAMGTPDLNQDTAHIASGMSILTASKKNEVSLEINGHGLFTALLLDALRGGAADLRGCITPGSVYAYIDQALGSWSQRPIFRTNITHFVALRTIAPPIPLDVLRTITAYFPTPSSEHHLDRSYEITNGEEALDENVAVFKNLQKMNRVGLVVPVGEEHMYYAAQNAASCRLTNLGYHYWRLVKDKKI